MRVWDVFICLGHSKDMHVYCRTSKWWREYHHNATSSSPTAHRSPMGGFTMQRCSECVCVCWSLMMGRHKRWSERKTRQENRDMRKVDKKGERQRRWERWGSETQLHSFGDAHILVHISPCDQSTQKTSNCHSHTRFHRSDSFWFTLNKQWKQILSKGT